MCGMADQVLACEQRLLPDAPLAELDVAPLHLNPGIVLGVKADGASMSTDTEQQVHNLHNSSFFVYFVYFVLFALPFATVPRLRCDGRGRGFLRLAASMDGIHHLASQFQIFGHFLLRAKHEINEIDEKSSLISLIRLSRGSRSGQTSRDVLRLFRDSRPCSCNRCGAPARCGQGSYSYQMVIHFIPVSPARAFPAARWVSRGTPTVVRRNVRCPHNGSNRQRGLRVFRRNDRAFVSGKSEGRTTCFASRSNAEHFRMAFG